jgi:YbbR domain-containing protein
VRLRGAANIVKDITPKQVSTTVDLSNVIPGERTIMLTAQNVQAPFGTEVIRINPSQVRISLEQTVSKMVAVVPTTQGQPADGFELGKVMVVRAGFAFKDPSRGSRRWSPFQRFRST